MSAHSENSKEKKQISVSKAVLEVIEKDGITGVTHSKVARKAGVSRAWIYEYIGKEKAALTEYAAEVFADKLSRIKQELPKNKSELRDQLKDATQFLFDSVTQDPVTIKLYFRFRGTENSIGRVISKYEKNWIERASKNASTLLSLPMDQSLLLTELALTLRFGFAFRIATANSPKAERERADAVFGLIYSTIESLDIV